MCLSNTNCSKLLGHSLWENIQNKKPKYQSVCVRPKYTPRCPVALTSAFSAVFMCLRHPSYTKTRSKERQDQIIIITYRDKQLETSLFLTPSFFPPYSLSLPLRSLTLPPTSPLLSSFLLLPSISLLAPIEWIVIMSGISSALCTPLLY